MGKKVLIVSAHPDDEILGAGGSLIRHREAGDELAWLIVTQIKTDFGFTEERVNSRIIEIDQVARQLNAKVYQLDYPTMNLSGANLITLVPEISQVFGDFQPERIYVMNRSDAHSDHRIVFDAVYACTKSFRYPFVREVFMYECLSETEFAPALPERVFQPNCYIDISKELEEKLELMQIYASEMGNHPFPRSVENIQALATFRGATCGVQFAEAFQLIKSFRFEKL